MSAHPVPIAHPMHELKYESISPSMGRVGMWAFLASEIVTFGGVVCSYLLLRLCHPEWIQHSSKTLLPIGAINTVVLLTSSLTMVLAHHSAELKNVAATKKWLACTLLLGLLFLCFKGYEYTHEIENGYLPNTAVFWAFYFAMTGLHGLHVLAGLVTMAYLLIAIKEDYRLTAVAPVGLYWHFVDLVWIFLFPLLYVTTQGA